MKLLDKLFSGINMTWKRIIVISLVCGVVPGLLMLPKFLDGTSFQQPGIAYEFWILMALVIVSNCDKPLEAGLKTFVFFLISQPLIYLVQVPFSDLGWGLFGYYPRWGILTLFTLPGGMLAWRVKKDDILGVIILSLANFILATTLAEFFGETVHNFPKLFISCVFITAEIVCFILYFYRRRLTRITAFVIAAALIIVGGFIAHRRANPTAVTIGIDVPGDPPFEVVSTDGDFDTRTEGSLVFFTVSGDGTYTAVLKDADGDTITAALTKDGDSSTWDFGE